MNKKCKLRDFKNIIFLTLVIGFSVIGSLKAFASDNVLQAVQIDGVKDSYNIVLRSDDTAELKKTVQAPNKMILTLKGIRASKSINTIYNNTANVDSVVVEPIGENEIKILIQADNVDKAEINFDTLKTPLGVLGSSNKENNKDELVLSKPVQSYRPVYDNSLDEEDASGLSGILSNPIIKKVKKALKNDKISWTITIGLFSIMLLSGIKAIKGKDNEIKVGLSQSLKERELDLYRANASAQLQNGLNGGLPVGMQGNYGMANAAPQNVASTTPIAGANYGLKAYQNGARSPYVSSEVQRPRPSVAPTPAPSKASYQNLQQAARPAQQMQKTVQSPIQGRTSMATQNRTAARPKTTNIDSMKFLESMTKIYEKNGRSDLAQGLKTNMKKAKINMA